MTEHPIRSYPDERREMAEGDMLGVFPPETETAEQQRDQLAGTVDRVRALAVEYPVAVPTNLLDEALDEQQDGEHIYLSTACLHDRHDYCQSDTGLGGAKKPSRCKFCGAICRCQTCRHQESA